MATATWTITLDTDKEYLSLLAIDQEKIAPLMTELRRVFGKDKVNAIMSYKK